MTERRTAETWCGLSALSAAARACARRKRKRLDAIGFRMREGEEILALSQRLEAGTYHPEPGRVFVTDRPKHREIHAAAYRDRVVHHLLHGLLEPAFDSSFSSASFACRRGKGTHAAANHLQEEMWRLSRHAHVRVFALQMDVVNFFMSLHKPTLLALLGPRVRRLQSSLGARLPVSGFGPWELTQRIVLHEPARLARRIGPTGAFRRVPAHKRLGALGSDRGLPIGNLTSQFFANVYLTPLDHFIQRTLGFGEYVRYVDDFIVLDTDAERLHAASERIVEFLRERLFLDVRAKPITPVSRGVDFVGYIVRPRYVLPRRRVVHALRECLDDAAIRLAPFDVPPGVRVGLPKLGPVKGPVRVTRFDMAACERLRALWSSYEGHFRHAHAFRLRARLWQSYPVCNRLLELKDGHVTRRFALSRPAPSLPFQVRDLEVGITPPGASRAGVLLLQVGRFVEMPRAPWRFGVRRLWRKGRMRAGLPWVATHRLIQRILKKGHAVAVALEAPESAGNVKRRRLAYLFEPISLESITQETNR